MSHAASSTQKTPALMALLVATVTLACGTTPTESLGDTDQAFLFEVEYAGSWFPSWTGITIGSSGEITSYRREDTPWVPADNESFTTAELQEKYNANPVVIGQLDQATLENAFSLIAEVGDNLSNPNAVCADAGSLKYTALTYNQTTGRYQPLLLREEGDFPVQNRGGSAPVLSVWLRTVIVGYPVDGLQPFHEGTCTP